MYAQEGLAMGLPLSPILAEIFMDHLENNLFNSKFPLVSNAFYWYRYMDVILCCWTGLQFLHYFKFNTPTWY